jgi:prevent-host-death family protein
MYNPSMASMSVSELRAHLRDALERVQKGEEIEVTRDGRVAAVLMHPSRIRMRTRAAEALAGAEQIRRRIEAARDLPLSATGGVSAERAEEMVAEIRASRARRRGRR